MLLPQFCHALNLSNSLPSTPHFVDYFINPVPRISFFIDKMSDPEQVRIESEKQVTYEVKGKVAIITINRPEKLNAMNIFHYWAIEEHVKRAAEEPNTVVTLIQSTGKFFSAGADVSSGNSAPQSETQNYEVDWMARRDLAGRFTGRNAIVVDTFWNHPKVLVVALNGPVVGLTTGLVSLADFIFARESAYLLTPFANLGLVAEGGTSFTLPARLGLSLASKALLAAEPIRAEELFRAGFVNKLYPASMSTEEFNAEVLKYIEHRFSDLDPRSLLEIKQLIHAPYSAHFSQSSAAEIIGGLDKFARGRPQERFSMIAAGKLKHKL